MSDINKYKGHFATFSDDGKRAVIEYIHGEGFPCFAGSTLEGAVFNGKQVGFAETLRDANNFLLGKKAKLTQ